MVPCSKQHAFSLVTQSCFRKKLFCGTSKRLDSCRSSWATNWAVLSERVH